MHRPDGRLIFPGMAKHPKRPRDPNQLAKMIVDLATGEAEEQDPSKGKDPTAVRLGRRGGLKGGRARAEYMTAEQRSVVARKAALKRWRDSG